MRKLCPLVGGLRIPIANQEVPTTEKGDGGIFGGSTGSFVGWWGSICIPICTS